MRTLICFALAMLVMWGGIGRDIAAPAWAQSLLAAAQTAAIKDIIAVPNNQAAPVDLKIEVDGTELREGQTTKICFSTSQPGYVTVWNLGTSGKVVRLFPYTADGKPEAVAAGRHCVGGPNASHTFSVRSPYGTEDSYVVWTRTPEAQPRRPSFADAGGLTRDLSVVAGMPLQDWATAKVTYDIVGPNGRQLPSAPPVAPAVQAAGSGRTFVLSMGSDVGELSKTNDDAKRFADQTAQLLRVPEQNVRFIRNATRSDFEAGMAWLAQVAAPEDLVFIFFSGHGTQIPDDDGDELDLLDEAFVTYNVQNNPNWTERDVVRDDDFARMVSRLRTDRVVSVLDTCHSGGLRKSLIPTGVRTKYLFNSKLRSMAGVRTVSTARHKDMAGGIDGNAQGGPALKGVVLAAAQESEYALEGAEGSLFTLAWMKAVTGGGTLRTAFDRAVADTLQRSRGQQTPAMVGDLRILDTVRLN